MSLADLIWHGKPGGIWESDPKGGVPTLIWGSVPTILYQGFEAPEKEPTLVVPSLRWECAGMYTVFVLCCYGAYLIAAI